MLIPIARMLPFGAIALTLAVSVHAETVKSARPFAYRASAAIREEQTILVALARAESAAHTYVATSNSAALRESDGAMRAVARHTAVLDRVLTGDASRATGAQEFDDLVRGERDALRIAVEAERAGRHGDAAFGMSRVAHARFIERLRSASATFDLAESRYAAKLQNAAHEPARLAVR